MNKKTIIKAVKTVIDTKTNLPILETVHLSDDHIMITDLITFVSIPYHSGVNTCISAERLMKVLDMMERPSFTVTEGKDASGKTTYSVEIKGGNKKIALAGENPKDFPLSDNQRSDAPAYLEVGEISVKEMEYLEEAMKFVSKDELRPILTGVYIGKDIAATDAHRLYWRKLENMKEAFILPKKTIKAMLLFKGPWKVYCGIKYLPLAKNQQEPEIQSKWGMLVNDEGVVISFNPIDGRFPDYRVVIPTSTPTASLEIDPIILRKELSNALAFCNDATNQGVFTLNGHAELVSCNEDEKTRYEAIFDKKDAQYYGELTIAFNMKFLDEIASLIPKNEKMKFDFWGSTKSTVINGGYLVMPIILNN